MTYEIEYSVIDINRRHRSIGPGVAYSVNDGGADLPIGGSILSSSADHERRVADLAERFEDVVDVEGFEHGDTIAVVSWEDAEDDDPDVDWVVDEPEGWSE